MQIVCSSGMLWFLHDRFWNYFVMAVALPLIVCKHIIFPFFNQILICFITYDSPE